MITSSFQESVTSAIRYWERGRIAYNVVLAAVVAAVFGVFWPASANMFSVDMFQSLFALAVMSNVAYCAAYPVDLLAQASGYRTTWLRIRWMLLAVGIAFASVIAQFIARGMLGNAI